MDRTPASISIRGKVMIVTHDAAGLQDLTAMLSESGNLLLPMLDCAQSLAKALVTPPDLILLDLELPASGAIDFCRRMRSVLETRSVPIIVISNSNDDVMKSKVLAAGATDFVAKPIDTFKTKARIITHLRAHRLQQRLSSEITKRRRTERSLADSREIINSSPVVAFKWQNEEGWPVEHVSANVVDLFGYTAAEFISGQIAYSEVVHPDDLTMCGNDVTRYSADLGCRRFVHKPYRIITKSGDTRWIDDRTTICRNTAGEVTHYRGIVLDITDHIKSEENQKQLQNSLYQSDKMASIGQLAAGVAHEINNPIGFILCNLNTMKEYIGELRDFMATRELAPAGSTGEIAELMADFSDAITESVDGANRIKNIVADMKGFSRTDSDSAEPVDINAGLESTLNIVWNQLKYKCKVEKNLGELPPVTCFAGRINQVLLNLLVNAGQAIDDGADGHIEVRTWAADESIHVLIGDNGCGIPPENLKNIFNAFFTTKEVGQGTGLGLSLSHDIITKHGGRLEVRSEVGVGTEFEVILPLVEELQLV